MRRFFAKKIKRETRENGYLLVLVMVISFALMTIATALMSVSSTKYAKTDSDGDTSKAVYVAEAGISDTVNRINLNNTFAGYSTPQTFYSSAQRGKAEYTTTAVAGASNTITVTSVGSYFSKPSSTTPTVTRTVKVVLTRTQTPITENVLAGSAGLTVSGAYTPYYGQPVAMQKGSVYSRGKIRLNGELASLGSATDSARVTAANIGCGTTANFPQQCATNDPPLTFGGTGFYSGAGSIYGSVCAANQPASPYIHTGPTGTGLDSTCSPSDYGLLPFDKAAFTATKTVGTGVAPSSVSCSFTDSTADWADNVKVNGAVTLSPALFGGCQVTIRGDVYIKGNLTINSGTVITVDASLLGRKPIIGVNGVITVEKGVSILANDSGSHATFLSFNSTDTTCTTSDTCSAISSTHLYNSSQTLTGVPDWAQAWGRAIVLRGFGGNQPNFSGAAFYSLFGSTLYTMDGAVSINGIGGQHVAVSPGTSYLSLGGTLSIVGISPFSHIFQRNKYVIGDYIQQF